MLSLSVWLYCIKSILHSRIWHHPIIKNIVSSFVILDLRPISIANWIVENKGTSTLCSVCPTLFCRSQFRELGYSLESTKWAGVHDKVGRSQVYFGLGLFSTSWWETVISSLKEILQIYKTKLHFQKFPVCCLIKFHLHITAALCAFANCFWTHDSGKIFLNNF